MELERMKPVEIAVDAALLVIRNDGSTVAAERSFDKILRGYKEEANEGVWRLDFIAARSTADGQSSAVVQPVVGFHNAITSEVRAKPPTAASDSATMNVMLNPWPRPMARRSRTRRQC